MTAVGSTLTEFVRVRIGSIHYVLPVAAVAAVLDLSTVERAGSRPGSFWIGTIRSRRSTIRVADGGRVFGNEHDAHLQSKVVVLRAGLPVGFTVDEVFGSRLVNQEDIYAIPETAGTARQLLVHAVVWADKTVELAIDHSGLVDALSSNRIDVGTAGLHEVQLNFDTDGVDVLEVEIAGSAERWALPISMVRHIAGYCEPQPLARASNDVLGLLAWQRRPIPLIAASARLGLGGEHPCGGQVVVVGETVRDGRGEKPAVAALLVERVVGIHTIQEADGDRQTTSGGTLRRLNLAELLSGGYRAESRATEFVSDPIPSISIVT